MQFLLSLLKLFVRSYTPPIDSSGIRTVLVVYPGHIGDIILASPVYRALKEHLHGARVDGLIFPITKDVLIDNPYVDELHIYPDHNRFQRLKILLKLRKKKYDLVLQLNTSLKINALIRVIGTRYRLGYDYKHRGFLNNIRIPIATRTAQTRYFVDECLNVLEVAFGWNITNRSMIFTINKNYQQRVKNLLRKYKVEDSDLVIGMHTYCHPTWKGRRWEQHKFSLLADVLIERYGAKIVFTDSADNREYVEPILSGIKHQKNILDFVEGLSLKELGALLQRIDVFVTINTGPTQIAISQSTPTVVLTAANPPQIFYPMSNPRFQYVTGVSAPSNGSSEYHPKHLSRMKSIQVDHVVEKVEFLLKSFKAEKLHKRIAVAEENAFRTSALSDLS